MKKLEKASNKAKNKAGKEKVRMGKNMSFFDQKPLTVFGGNDRKKARQRQERPLAISRKSNSSSIHVVLRSTQAKGAFSFLHAKNKKKINSFVQQFSKQKHIEILKYANVGNHLHLHVKVLSRKLYNEWIRGLTSAIAMYAAGLDGLTKLKQIGKTFWDQRPFTQLIQSFKHFQNTKKYVEINILESMGYPRKLAEFYIHEIWKTKLLTT